MNLIQLLLEESDNVEFSPQRLKLARERRGLTKEELAVLCGVSRRAVTDWESGRVENPPVSRIAEKLDFPDRFFFGAPLDEIPEDAVAFRARTSMSARNTLRVLASASFVKLFSEWIDERYETPPPAVPRLEEFYSPEKEGEPDPSSAATALRAFWNLGDKPISNILQLLESHGVRVFGLDGEVRDVDAFSFWQDARPYILVDMTKSAERIRFDLAHELGHLCIHREVKTNKQRRLEEQANAFASSFLMPRIGLIRQASNRLTIDDVFKLKRYWRVSATAMVKRLHQLGLINDWQYRGWMVDLSERGFRKSEPDGLQVERSAFIPAILKIAREDGLRVAKIADTLGIPRAEIESLLMGFAISSIDGDGVGASLSSDRAALRAL